VTGRAGVSAVPGMNFLRLGSRHMHLVYGAMKPNRRDPWLRQMPTDATDCQPLVSLSSPLTTRPPLKHPARESLAATPPPSYWNQARVTNIRPVAPPPPTTTNGPSPTARVSAAGFPASQTPW